MLQLRCWTHLALAPGSHSQYSPSVWAARHGAGGQDEGPVVPQSWGRGHSSNRAVGEILMARLPGSKDLKEAGEGDWVVEGGRSG